MRLNEVAVSTNIIDLRWGQGICAPIDTPWAVLLDALPTITITTCTFALTMTLVGWAIMRLKGMQA